MKRFAVIDLGTNTFHLLIAGRKKNNSYVEIYCERIYVKLGEEGMTKLSLSAMKRAFEALSKFKQVIDLFEAIDCRAMATAAFRNASNANVFIHRVSRELDIDIQIISGKVEANYIYEGVKYGGGLQPGQNFLIDIGGGSVEFISADKEKVTWADSFPIGVRILKNKFHLSEPISKLEICELKQFIKKQLSEVKINIEKYNYNTLIGCSGTFDILSSVLTKKESINNFNVFSVAEYKNYLRYFIELDLADRLQKEEIPESRAELIVVAFLLIECILEMGSFQYILVSPYALKEGVLSEMFDVVKR